MTLKEQIIQELDETPDSLLEQVLNFLKFLRNLPYSRDKVHIFRKPHPLFGLNFEDRKVRIHSMLGAWQGNLELDIFFSEMDKARHAYRGRQIDSFDDD